MCTRHLFFADLPFQTHDPQPNPLKIIVNPFPTQLNPAQPVGQPNPWTTLMAMALFGMLGPLMVYMATILYSKPEIT